jgi:hypothetical protein
VALAVSLIDSGIVTDAFSAASDTADGVPS